ncbi:MAG TPA: hypothetical protein QF720_03380 [Nitrospinota bacterium]|nr:hypothetical protein [Nitrospinota bacterium]
MIKTFKFPAGLFALAMALAVFKPSIGQALPSYARYNSSTCFTCHTMTPSEFNSLTRSSKELGLAGSELYSIPLPGLKAGVRVRTNVLNNSGETTTKLLNNRVGDGYLSSDKNSTLQKTPEITGVTGYLETDYFSASFGLLRPDLSLHPTFSQYLFPDSTSATSLWYRLALTPRHGDLGFSLGIFGLSATGANQQLLSTSEIYSYGVDANLRNTIGDLTLGFNAVYMDNSNLNNRGRGLPNPFKSGSFSAEAQVGITNSFGLSAAYRTYRNSEGPIFNLGSSSMEQSATIGLWINMSDRLIIQPQYTTFGDDKEIINQSGEFRLRLFTGF